MANLRTAMDSAFWDLNVSSPHTLEGSAKAIPGDPFPLDGARACRALRIQQLSLRGNGFPLEAAWPELFIDHKGQYWDVPESISLDLSSLVSESGLRYRVGIHKNSGHPQAVNAVNDEAPTSLMPGLCAKAAFSYEKSRDLWRQKETQNDLMVKKDRGWFWRPSYDVRLKEPHAAVSGIFGGSFAAWFQDGHSPVAVELRGDGNTSSSTKK